MSRFLYISSDDTPKKAGKELKLRVSFFRGVVFPSQYTFGWFFLSTSFQQLPHWDYILKRHRPLKTSTLGFVCSRLAKFWGKTRYVLFLVTYNINTLITETVLKFCGVLALGVDTHLYFAGKDAKKGPGAIRFTHANKVWTHLLGFTFR